MVSDARSRAVDKVARLASESTDLVSFWRTSTEVVSPVLPHWWAPCFFTLDPASTLVTSHFHEGLDEFPADALIAEYYGNDVHQIVDVDGNVFRYAEIYSNMNVEHPDSFPAKPARVSFAVTPAQNAPTNGR